MAFTTVDRNNGQTFREQDVDAFQGNDDHVRAEADWKLIANQLDLAYAGLASAAVVDIEVSGVDLVEDGTGENHVADVDVSSLSAGIHILQITVGGNVRKLRLVKTSDLEYISIWWKIRNVYDSGSSTYTAHVDWLTIVGHRTAQYW
jgi:hypothetical protein